MSQYGWKFAPGSATLQLRVYIYFRVGARSPWVGQVAPQKRKKYLIAGVITPLRTQCPRLDGNLHQGLTRFNEEGIII
jgi:hypothetical protein